MILKNNIQCRIKCFEIFKKTLVIMIVGILLGTTVTFFKEAYGEDTLTESQLKQCEHLYFNFKKFGEKEFIYRYSFKSFIKECVKLYNTPEWTFDGKDKIDKYFEKLETAKTSKQYTPSKVVTSIFSKYRIDETRYVISFEACTDSSRTMGIFLIYSDIDKFIGTSERLIPKDSCSTYWTNVYAKLPNSIGVQYVNDLHEYPNLIKKQLKN